MQRKIVRGVSILLASASLSVIAFTQAAAQQAPPTAVVTDTPPAQEVVVTGTRIRGVAPVGAPVIQVTTQYIGDVGAQNSSDLLRTIPQLLNLGATSSYSNTSASASSTSNISSADSINLRGIGVDATLVLIDSRRTAGGGPNASIVDPSIIPQIALSGIEVVPDGASAIYGSDAIAGVVNLRLRPDYDGFRTDVRYGTANSGNSEWSASGLAGKKWDSGGFMVAYEHTHEDPLEANKNSQYYNSNLTAYGVPLTAASYNSSPGNIKVSSGTIKYGTGVQTCTSINPCYVGIPTGSDATYAGLQSAPGVFNAPNVSNIWSNQWATPRNDRDAFVFKVHQTVFDGVELSNELYYTNRNFVRNAGDSDTATLNIPNTNPTSPCYHYVATPICSGASTSVLYRYTPELGSIYSPGYSSNFTDTAAANARLWADWRAELSATYSLAHDVENTAESGVAATGPGSTPAQQAAYLAAFNPYGSVSNANNAALIGTPVPFANKLFHEMQNYALRLDGPLFSLPAGAVKAAAGIEFRSEYLGYFRTNFPSPPQVTGLGRNVGSVYGEVFIPVVSEGMAIPFVSKVDLDVADRFERYSDFGSTNNPKVGLTWTVIPGLLMKGSYGTSFRAPELSELAYPLNGVTLVSAETLAGGGTGNVLFVGGGNPALQPVTAKTYSFGPEWRPSFAPDLKLTLDYYNISEQGEISEPTTPSNTQVLSNPIYSSFIIAQGAALTPAVVQQWLNYITNSGNTLRNSLCPTDATGLASCLTAIVDGRTKNSGQTQTSGLDLSGDYLLKSRYGAFDFNAVGAYVIDFKTALTPTAPLVDYVGTNNGTYPVRFKARAGVSWQMGAYRVATFVNYTSGYHNTTIQNAPAQNVASWTTMDLNLAYDLGRFGGLAKGANVSLNFVNLFNAAPPFVLFEGSTYTTFDPQNANAFGRQVSFKISKTW